MAPLIPNLFTFGLAPSHRAAPPRLWRCSRLGFGVDLMDVKPKHPKPPKHLKPGTRRWWKEVVTDWRLEEHHRRLLTLAGEAWDRCGQARELIETDGLTVPTKAGGPRLHPAVRVEQDARLAFARLIRELDLDVTPPADAPRAPALRSVVR
jgi:P27 family predicted phage terminase small subunit